MGLKILHSADWHLDSPFVGFSPEQREYLRQQQNRLPERIADICCREGCDLMLLAGDLFDGEATQESIRLTKNALSDCGVPVFISPGNHDFCSPGSPWLEEGWPENVHIFTGSLESVVLPQLDCRIYGAGYQSMDCPALLTDFQPEGTEKYRIGVFHGDPVTSGSPYNPITPAQVRGSDLDYLALGHIHKAGSFRAGTTLCAWPGCPMGRGWDETGEKGICLVTLENTPQLRMLRLDTVTFQDQQVDIGEDAIAALETVLPGTHSQDFFRMTLTGCGQVDIPRLMQHFSHLPNLELRDQTEEPIDLWADVGEDTLRGMYFSMLRQISETDPRAKLAAEISHRLLSGKEVKLP